MRFGVCRGIDRTDDVTAAAKAGFDYIECGFSGLSREPDEVFEAFKSCLEQNDIKCEAANGFFPRDMKILAADFDTEAAAAYVEKGMERGSRVGLKTVVFGSGKAREVPEGMSAEEGYEKLGAFLRETVSPIAAKYGITVVIEPLRADESNIVNSVYDGAKLASAAACDNVYGLADVYHMLGCGDTNEDVIKLKGIIKHGHISCPESKNGQKRTYPADKNEFDYKGFVDALEKAGCPRCSIEAGCTDFAAEAPAALAVIKGL